VTARVLSFNARALACLSACGFVEEGRERESVPFEGLRHDCGDKLGFLKATVDMALKRDEFKVEFEKYLRQRLAFTCYK